MKVLFEDKFIIICEKPANVLSEPGTGGEDIVTLADKVVRDYIYSKNKFITI